MAPQKKLTEYERRRLENIKRNEEVLSSLKIHSKLAELSALTKRQRPQTKSYKLSPEKKLKSDAPTVIRRSLRTRGMPPEAATAGGLKDDFDESPNTQKSNPKPEPPTCKGPISIREAFYGEDYDQRFTETILGVSKKIQLSYGDGPTEGIDSGYPSRALGSVNLGSLRLDPENIARVVQGKIHVVRFFPSSDLNMIAVGNTSGDVGFWNVDAKNQDGDGIYLFHPYSGAVSGIVVQPFSLSKIYTSSYDGIIQLMDLEKEEFDQIYSCDGPIFSISQRASDPKSLYFSDGHGVLSIWDERTGKSSTSWILHENRINSIDFSSENNNLMATSSTDKTARIWDLRNIGADNPKPLKTINLTRAAQSAYFSPSGSCLATTSYDNMVGLLRGANFEEVSMIHHNNQTGRWLSPFRAIWGWDDSYIYIGNMNRGVDVISTAKRRIFTTLQSPDMSAIPCRFDAHPYKIGMLAGGTSGGQVYVWTHC
ncbi:DNA damage-binding protein CMR1 [Diospyros lotus]|uniref:DNA damage-binding protein CMR1 n=1 Tax=Diospyros lotus TaxID=55363 RepID=UPI00224C7E1A|nr:DNA damage-binding protein CMR1 [Diospyros lotus]